MDRRTILTGSVCFLAAPLAAEAQQTHKIPRIGALVVAAPGLPSVEGFRQGLRELGYVEGQSIAVEYRYAEGKSERYGALSAELVRQEPDVIVVWGTELARAARRATSTIPIVLALGDRPVEMGLVADLARPGGNVTGVLRQNPVRPRGASSSARRPGCTGNRMLQKPERIAPCRLRSLRRAWSNGLSTARGPRHTTSAKRL